MSGSQSIILHYHDGIRNSEHENSHVEVRDDATMRIAHLSCMMATGLEVPDPFLGYVQQGKDREIALSFNSMLSQTGKW